MVIDSAIFRKTKRKTKNIGRIEKVKVFFDLPIDNKHLKSRTASRLVMSVCIEAIEIHEFGTMQ